MLLIFAPVDGQRFVTSTDGRAEVRFHARAADGPAGQDLSARIQWVSDLQGSVGKGGQFSTRLQEGTHHLTCRVTGTSGITTEVQRTVHVRPPAELFAVAIRAPVWGKNAYVSWRDVNRAEDGYIVELSSRSDGGFAEVLRMVGKQWQFALVELPVGTSYARVRSYKGTTLGPVSNVVEVVRKR